MKLGQYWLKLWLGAWWHQGITWTNVDLLSLRSSIHLWIILQDMIKKNKNIFEIYMFKSTSMLFRDKWVIENNHEYYLIETSLH